MGDEIRCTATVRVRGENYDELVRKARAEAVAFLGTERAYYLALDCVQRDLESSAWWTDARITYPHEPAF